MKRIAFLLLIFLGLEVLVGFAQIPNEFNYQAVIRDASEELVKNQNVSIKISILDESETILYSETHAVTSNAYGMINVKVGSGVPVTNTFESIDWAGSSNLIKVEADINGGTAYVEIGTSELVSVPYALHSISATSLGDKGVYSTDTDTLFVVKDHSGNVVFAVFPDGAEIIVDEFAKGKIGGFAVSGRNPNKADLTDEFIRVTRDSTRITFNEAAKGKVGGFAVSGRNPNKAGLTSSIINLFPDNYFIGDSAGINNTIGLYNLFIGYKSGKENTTGSYNFFTGYNAGINNIGGNQNIFIGYKAGFSNVGNTSGNPTFDYLGSHNVFIGDEAGYSNQSGRFNVFIGEGSGYSFDAGWYNTAVGFNAAKNSTGGIYNLCVGSNSGQSNEGDFNSFVGPQAGQSNTTGNDNTYVGHQSGLSNTTGSSNTFIGKYAGRNNALGSGNVFIGNYAGHDETGSDKLYITNWDDSSPLIYGNFSLDRLSFNGNVGVNRDPYSSVSLSVSPAGLAYGMYVDAGSTIYAAYFNGDIYTTGSYVTSDEKFKKNVVAVSKTLKELSNLNAVYYYWKTEEFPERKFTGRKQIGFMAQEVENSFPELVKQDIEGNRAIDYSKFTPILVEAIKEQQIIIDTQKDEINELNKRVNKLEELVNQLMLK
jgi:hypothetical protein